MNSPETQSRHSVQRFVRQYRESRHDGLLAQYVIVGRVKLGIGWARNWWQTEDCWPIACNRVVSWRYERAVCISVLGLRIGFRILPNDRTERPPTQTP